VRFWLRGVSQREFLAGRSAAVVAIKRVFDERQITIPFPIRTLALDTTSRSMLEAISSRRNDNGRARREPRAKE
jgi:small-conductance mechanosensitive channel